MQRICENRMSRTEGKEGFVIRKGTRVCNLLIQLSDILCVE